MYKFCSNCGAVADDNAMVCGNCGTPFPAAQQPVQPQVQPGYQPPVQPGYQAPVQPTYQTPVQPTYQAPAQPAYQPPVQPGYNPMPGAPVMNQNIPGVTNNGAKKNGVIPKIIAAVLAVVILIVGVSAVFGGSGYKGIVKDFAKAIETGNGNAIAKHFYDGHTYYNKDDISEAFEELHDELCDAFDTNKIKVSYKNIDTEEVSKSDVEDYWDISKEGMIVKFDLTVKANGEEETFKAGLYLIKDGGWKFIDFDIDF